MLTDKDAANQQTNKQTVYTYPTSDTDPNRDLPLTDTDAVGACASFTYDSHGNILTVTQDIGQNHGDTTSQTRYTYSDVAVGSVTMHDAQTKEEKLISSTDGWTETDYSHFASNGLAQTTTDVGVALQDGGTTQNLTEGDTFDAFGNDVTATGLDGNAAVTYTYDLAGNMLTSTGAAATATYFTGTLSDSSTPTVVNDNHYVIHENHDSWNRVTETYDTASTDSSGTKFDWNQASYDACGREVQMKQMRWTSAHPEGQTDSTVTATYDGLGRVVASDDSTVANPQARTAYDAAGHVVASWPEGVSQANDATATVTIYNADNQQTSANAPAISRPATATYLPSGQVLLGTAPDGSSVQNGYDDAGNLKSQTSSLGATVSLTPNLDGSVHQLVSPSGLSTTYAYDNLGRVVQAQATGTPSPTATTYNKLDWALKQTDASNVTSKVTYDVFGRTVGSQVQGQNASASTYDACGRLLSQTDPSGVTVTYSYDFFGNVSEETHVKPGSPPTTLKDEKSEYDSLGRPAATIDAVSKVGSNFAYPLNTPPTTSQTLESLMQDGAGASKLTTNVSADPSGVEYSRQTSDQAGHQVTRTVVTRDSAQRWTQATLSGFGGSGSLTLALSFDAATGKLAAQSGAGYATGGQTSYNYYSSGAQIGMLQSETSQLAFGPAISSSYIYGSSGTGVGRLTQATTGSDALSFAYDAFGNLTSETKNGPATDYVYDSQGTSRLQSKTIGSNTTNYYWDEGLANAYGWRTSQGPSATPHQIQYGYTGNGELSSFTNSDPNNTVSANYIYDGTGLRTHSAVTKNGGTQTATAYGCADDGSLLNLSAAQGSATWSVDYLYDEEGVPYGGVYRSSAASAPVFFAIVTNQRGDVLELLDANGKAFAAYRYDAWGLPTGAGNCDTGIWTQETRDASNNIVVSAAAASEIAKRQVLKFAGYIYDSDSGLYYCSVRYYDPAARQWLTGDPAQADGEASAYQYCQGDPVQNVDPTGQVTVQKSGAWCGYVQKNGSCRGAEGFFNVRKTTVNKYGNGTWIGMGGFGPHHLLQAGVNQKKMKAWWEKVDPPLGEDPFNRVRYKYVVNQDDEMHVKIIETGGNKYFLRITDQSTGSSYKVNVYGFEPQKTADFIYEVKGYLGHFGTITFTKSIWWTDDGRHRNLSSGGGLYEIYVRRALSNGAKKAYMTLWPDKITNKNEFSITHN